MADVRPLTACEVDSSRSRSDKSDATESLRREMVGLAGDVASRYLGCGRLFEATHVLEEAIDLAKSLGRRDSFPLSDGRTPLPQLLQQQQLCLRRLGRASEEYRLLATKPADHATAQSKA